MPASRFEFRRLTGPAAALLVGLITLAVFLPALHNGFVRWDDQSNLVDNANFRGFSWTNFKWMWTNHLLSHYVPLAWMSLGLDYTFWKDNPLGYHLTNILLHASNAAVFFLLALAIFKAAFDCAQTRVSGLIFGAMFAALLFGLHPLRAESVAWVTERRDVLSGLFYLLALLVYVRGFSREPGQPPKQSLSPKSYIACLILFMLSILSKEIAVTFPVILLVLDACPLGRFGNRAAWSAAGIWRLIIEKLPFFLVAFADAAMTFFVGMRTHVMDSVSEMGWSTRVAITAYDFAFYVYKTLIPTGLTAMYPITAHKVALLGRPFLLSAAAIIAITAACLILRKRFPGLLAAWVAFSVILIPVTGIIHNGPQIAADRYTYLSCLGFALLAGGGSILAWRALRSRTAARALLAITCVVVLAALSILTRAQVATWRDTDSLWTHAISVEPSFAAHINLGTSFFNQGDTLGAVEQYRRGVALMPLSAIGHADLGRALLDLRQLDAAAREFQLAIALNPSVAAYNGLAHVWMLEGRFDEAAEALVKALRMNPSDAEVRRNLEMVMASRASKSPAPAPRP